MATTMQQYPVIVNPASKTLTDETPSYPRFTMAALRSFFAISGRLAPRWSAKIAFKLFCTPRMRARHKVSDNILEEARVFDVLYGKQFLKGYEWGQGTRTVLLVHGWESRGTALRSFVPELVAAGFRVVAMDGPAHGDSAGKMTNLPHFAGAVKAFIRQLGGVYGIITHSFGGASTTFALAQPANEIRVEKLVMIAPPNSLERVTDHYIGLVSAPAKMSYYFKKMIENLAKMPVSKIEIAAMADRVDVGETLLVHDKNDMVVSYERSQIIARAWQNASVLTTEGFGHYLLMKNEKVVAAVADFMKD